MAKLPGAAVAPGVKIAVVRDRSGVGIAARHHLAQIALQINLLVGVDLAKRASA